MRSKLGTALALVAVLLTGTAAAAINTQALISPTETTLGTVATTLLPPDQTVVTVPGQTPVSSQNLNSSASSSQNSVSSTPVTQSSANSIPTAGIPATTQPSTSIASAPASPSVVYGNPNPSNGEDDDDDEDDDDEENDEDEDDD
jgi:hypothetical protein